MENFPRDMKKPAERINPESSKHEERAAAFATALSGYLLRGFSDSP